MKNATEIVLVLDESGSMLGIVNDTIGSINSFIEKQKEVPGECNVTIRTFNDCTKSKVVREGPLSGITKLTSSDYRPTCGTPLLDAIGEAIVDLGFKLSTKKESDRPDKIVFVIVTDGEENSSKAYTNARIKEMITHQQDVYKWAFIFLGAGVDAFAQGGNLGIKFSGIAAYNNTAKGYQQAVYITSDSVAKARMTGNLNAATFTASEQATIKSTA